MRLRHLPGKGIGKGGHEVQITRNEWMVRTWKKILLTVKVPPTRNLFGTMSPHWPNAQCQDTLPFLAARHSPWEWAGRKPMARMTAPKSHK